MSMIPVFCSRSGNGTNSKSLVLLAIAFLLTVLQASWAAPTSSQGGDSVLFSDDFNGGLNPLWTQKGNCTWQTEGGVLHSSLVGHQLRCSMAVGSLTWTDYVVEYDIRGNEGADKPVEFRREGDSGYGLSIRPTPRNDVVLTGHQGWLQAVSYSSFNGIWYHVRIDCRGNHITVSIDGAEVIDYVDNSSAYLSGGIELVCYTGDVGISDVSWDNVFVTELSSVVPCGDCDGSGSVDIADIVYFLNWMFQEGAPPVDEGEGDYNSDGGANIADAVYLISYIFAGGPAPCRGV